MHRHKVTFFVLFFSNRAFMKFLLLKKTIMLKADDHIKACGLTKNFSSSVFIVN